MKFHIMALLIAFSLFLMLSNVCFSVESYELVVAPSGEVAAQGSMKEINTVASFTFDITVERDGLASAESDREVVVQYWKEDQAKASGKSISCADNNSCKTVICTGGPIYNVFNEIEYFVDWCGHLFFDVVIEDCTFYNNTIDKSTFSGNFKMSTLTIRNCQLNTIVDNAFKYQSVNKLMNITFDGVQLKALNPQTFNGLEAVKNFKLFNVLTQTTSPLNANNFLQPMAATLSNLVLQQTEESNTIYDPTAWLDGTSTIVYSKLLYVDLSGTKFNDTLNGNTFAKLAVVQELRLANCSLSTIAENVFNDILSTLKSLDLRYNRLQTLDGKFLATVIGKGINIEFGWNLWSCNCDNVEIIEYMKQVENNSAAETVCATPTELHGVQIGNAQMRCVDDTTTLKTTIPAKSTTTAVTSETTTIMTTTTYETTIETTESDPETQPISSTTTINSSTTSLSPATTTMTTTADDTTVETTESSRKTSPTPTTPINNSTLPTLSPATTTMLTTSDDTAEETTESKTPINNSTTEETTESSSKTSPTPSTSAINNPTTTVDKTEKTTTSSPMASPETSSTSVSNSTSSPVTTVMPTTGTTEETTGSSPKASPTPSTTANNNSTTNKITESSTKYSPSTTASNNPTTTVDKTEKTTTSRPKTSPTPSTTPINNPTFSTPTTTIYSTTLSTSSGAVSIHRWHW
ncbi:uncharacterized protein LOC114803645 [Zeugodacus cucurbitae]|uniref:uncharacterized protein LOC114803645 n=1 Tax=Zeugodacus cucurbitae TaxID=28588 RepID=UPI0023D934B8|nr:uncharacterized protein LOC114803645 [Zeugodacus cucurbitae]